MRKKKICEKEISVQINGYQKKWEEHYLERMPANQIPRLFYKQNGSDDRRAGIILILAIKA